MTGFAAVTRDCAAGTVRIEFRSVNSRFLDLSFRCPDELRHAEWALRERITAAIQRGKIECRISFRPTDARGPSCTLNESAVIELAALADRIRAHIPDATAPSVAEVLRWPGVMADNQEEALAELGDIVQQAEIGRAHV